MKKIILVFLLSATFIGVSCKPKSSLKSYHLTRFAMGTVVEITVIDNSEEHANLALDAAMAEINRIGSLFYEGNPESPLYKFSHRTGDRMEMPPEVLNLIERGIKISDLTDGSFDMTVGILLPLWDFKSEKPSLPDDDDIQAVLQYVNYRELVIDHEKNLLISTSPQTMLATGAIAKGYAVDRAIKVLSEMKVEGALVNAGGDLRVIPRADGHPWRVGIQNPRRPEDLLRVIEIDSGAVVTSGDYQKYFMINGVRYHHLINPKTGYPADSCQSVTIIASTTEQADALATGVFVMGAEKGIKLLESLPEVEGLIVGINGEIIKSSGFDN